MNMVSLSSCWFLIHFVVLSLIALRGSFGTRSITSDQHSLLRLKAHISHDPQNILSNWTNSTSVCNWIGVTCGTKHLRVTALDLSDMALSGTIPPDLGNLSFLTSISFFNNSFHGFLPDELANLHRMKSFVFAINSLSGEIPTWVGSFPELQLLSLGTNNFSGTIPTSICNLSKLSGLSLQRNMLSGSIPGKIGNLANLRILFLAYNRLSGSIPSGLFNLSTAENIDLSDNFFSGFIPNPIVNMTSLLLLDFAYNNLTGVLPENMFSYFPNLELLTFSWNMLSGPIPLSVFLCSKLRILSLSNNYFDGAISNKIGNLTMLQLLYLGRNNFSGGAIPFSISNLLRLQILSLPRSSLTGSLPPGLGNLTQLQMIDLTENELTGTIPPEISNLNNLQSLNFGVNSISGLIPSGIFNNSNLQILVLTSNFLSGQLPTTMGLHLPNLRVLLVPDNDLSGPLPIYMSNASELFEISFSQNEFSGPIIPSGLGNLRYLQRLLLGNNNLTTKSLSSDLSSLTSYRNLRSLDLSENPLKVEFPSTVGNFSSLQQLLASGCKFNGTIPQEIGNMKNLTTLDLGSNELAGPIPDTIGNLHNLQALYLTENRLQGTLPSKLCSLQQLAYLILGGNDLSGPIPSCLGIMISLRTLSLESNKFISSIPSSLWRLNDVLIVNLSKNLLTGPLSPAVQNLKALTTLDLSENNLSGDMPSSFGDLKNLLSLSLYGNRFEGSVPDSFGDMISLEFLDLSRNNLSGELPMSLEKLEHLSYFNVSYNELDGEIPTGGPFKNFTNQSFMGNERLCSLVSLAKKRCNNRSKYGNIFKLKYVLLIVIRSTIFALALVIIIFRRFRMKNARLPTQQQNDLSSLATLKLVSIYELTKATNRFNETNLLGTGSFGSVYKGTLSDGTHVAVKVFNLQQEQAYKSFDVECEVLRNIRHRNLVKIISSCCNNDFKALVLEFMPNGNLEKWLYSHNYFLNMLQRLNIMIDVASALDYLHHGHHIPVVHCDLKPSNVLLDQEMVAHVGDFGISKLLGEGNEVMQTMTLATVGYMAPEYGSKGIVSTRCDIYSYGILLIETFTRRKPTDEMFTSELTMKNWIEEAVTNGSVVQAMDANLLYIDGENGEAKKECAVSVLALALKCCAESPEERIDIKEALNAINKIKSKFLVDVRYRNNRNQPSTT